MAQGITITHKDFMLATAARKPFDRPGWIFELKYDGFRVLAIRDADRARPLLKKRISSRARGKSGACFSRSTSSAGAARLEEAAAAQAQ